MDELKNYIASPIWDFLNLQILPTSGHGLTLGTIIHVSVLFALLVYLTKRLKRWLIERVLSKTSFELGFRYSLGTILSYAVVVLGLLIILDTAGINTTSITVVAGALGLGLSLSLQTIISNCFAGLFILLERRIKVGDTIQIGDLVGRITDVSLRSSSLLTTENTMVIVPNSDFISSRVINLSYNQKVKHLSLPFTVEWPGDLDLLLKTLTHAAEHEPGVLSDSDKPVEVLLKSFNKNERTLLINVWTEEFADKRELLRSNLNRSLIKAMQKQLDKSSKEPQRGNH
jgi:small-conductance mechanosensitive channel